MNKKIATRQAYGQTLKELGALNSDIVVLDADLSQSTKTGLFAQAFPERFFNAGIAEQNMAGVAAGLAASGKKVFISSFAVFATGRAFEQIRNSIAHPNLDVKIAASHAGITVGEDGATHQAIEDIALMRILPNMTVIVPADAIETKQVVEFAAASDGPFYIRLGRLDAPVIFDGSYKFIPGRAIKLAEGTDVTIIACGLMVSLAMQAADKLAEEGIKVRLLNMPTIKPVDIEAVVKAANDTGAIVTCEEHSIIGGLGSAIAETLSEYAPAPLERVGIKDIFGQSGTPDALLERYGLTTGEIILAAKKAISRKKT